MTMMAMIDDKLAETHDNAHREAIKQQFRWLLALVEKHERRTRATFKRTPTSETAKRHYAATKSLHDDLNDIALRHDINLYTVPKIP